MSDGTTTLIARALVCMGAELLLFFFQAPPYFAVGVFIIIWLILAARKDDAL